MYDWGRGEGYSHMAISTNSGTFANYADTNGPYYAVTGGSGDRIAQHSTDRVDSPWNWGYWTENSWSVVQNMRTKVLHLQQNRTALGFPRAVAGISTIT